MTDQLKEGQKVVIEGRLRMNSVTRKDGTKEKQAELTASRFHLITSVDNQTNIDQETSTSNNLNNTIGEKKDVNHDKESSTWNSAPLVPEVDEIPF